MKKYLTYNNLPWAVLAAGFLGMLLRLWLMSTKNELGFINRFHISAILILILTAAVVAALLILTRPLTQANKYSFNFPASVVGAAGALGASVCIAICSVMELTTAGDALQIISALTGILSALALLFAGHCRKNGLHPNVLTHVVICVYLMLHLICMYRQWSSDPQLYDYCFQLLAIVCAMLAAYHRATFDANFGKRHSYVFYNLSAVYFCVISLSERGWLFYLALGCWLFTDLCNLTPMPRQFREEAK